MGNVLEPAASEAERHSGKRVTLLVHPIGGTLA